MKKLKLISIIIILIVLSSSLFGILIGNNLYVEAASAEDMRNYERTFSTVYNCSEGHICTATQGFKSVGINDNLSSRQTSISKCNYPGCTGSITERNNYNMEKIINIREYDIGSYANNIYCVSHGQAVDIDDIMGNFYALASAEIRGQEATLKTYTKYGWERTAMTRTVTCLQNNEMAAVLNCIGNDTKGYMLTNGQHSDTQLGIWRGWSTWVEATSATENLFETCAGNDKWEDNGNRNSQTAWETPAAYAQNGTGRYFSADIYFLVYDSELNPYNGSGMQIDSFQNLILVIPHGEITSVNVNKEWVSNGLDIPSSVTVNLLADGTKVDNVTLNSSNSWKHTFANLDASKTYTVTENAVTGYSTSITENASNEFTITNTGQVVSVNVTKKWVDNSNNLNRRPGSVTVRLYKNGTITDQTISITGSSTGNTWTGSFTGLPKYDSSGNLITYTIKEENANVDYKCEITGTASSGFTITNTLTEMIDLKVIKDWNDEDDNDGVRPSSVTIRLYKDGVDTTRTLTLSNGNSWQGLFLKVPKYKYNGTTATELNYTIKEDYVPGYAATYSKSGNQFTVTNTHEVSNISLTVKKVWNDDNNRDGKRPESLNVWVTCAETVGVPVGATLNEENNWSYTWTRWSQYYEGSLQQFEVYEVPPEGYECTNQYSVGFGKANGWITIGNGYSTDSQGNVICTITNKHQPETIDLKVQKAWSGDSDDSDDSNNTGLRPSVIYADLYANGVRYNNSNNVPVSIKLNSSNSWTNTYTGLPKYNNGKEITYTVKESSASDSRLFTYYTTSISKSSETDDLITYKITNTFKQEYIKIKVRKVWDDQILKETNPEVRPDKVRFTISRLYSSGSVSEMEERIELTEDNYVGIDLQGRDIWEAELGLNLPKYYGGEECGYSLTETAYRENSDGTYSLMSSDFNKYYETPVIENDEGVYSGGYTLKTYTATNTARTKTIPVKKEWANGQSYGVTPDNVTIYLCKNEERTGQTLRLTSDANWEGEFSDLLKYDIDGNEIIYTVEENQQEYMKEPVITGNDEDGFVVTNSVITRELNISKVWEDNNNELGNRPTSVFIYLYRDGSPLDGYELNENNSWKETIVLPKYYYNGEECEYTVKEQTINYYDTSITGNMEDGYIITNVAQPLRNISVTKKWDDQDNKYGLRSTSYSDSYIEIELYQNNQSTGRTIKIWGDPNSSTWGPMTFSNLLIYDNEGNEIQYSVKEIDIPEGYESELSGNMSEGFTITNKVRLTKIKKIWEDNNNANGNRPEAIDFIIRKNGSTYGDVTLYAEDNWEYERYLPKYDEDGNEITYSLREIPWESYSDYEILKEGNRDDGLTITNALPLTIPVTKVWNDDDDRDGIRPDSVTVELYKNGTATGNTIVLSETNNWQAEFSKLQNFEDNERIQYTVIETNLPDGYTAQITGSMAEGFTIINTHEPEIIDIPIIKVWDDDNNRDGIRPNSTEIQLYKTVDEVTTSMGDEYKVILSATGLDGDWQDSDLTHVFENMYKYENGKNITYTIDEVIIPTGYSKIVTGNENDGFIITNTHVPETIDITIIKVWDDENDAEGIRPENIELQLYKTVENTTTSMGDEYKVIFSATGLDGDWQDSDLTHKFENMYKYENGKEIIYTVSEIKIPYDYTPTYQVTNEENGNQTFTITNTNVVEKVEMPIIKKWNDNSNENSKRPTEIDVLIKSDEQDDRQVKIKEEDNWETTVVLNKYYKNEEVIYTVEEAYIISNYESSDTIGDITQGFTITNTYVDEIQVSVSKVWDDGNNADGLRTTSTEVELYKNGEPTGETVTLSEDNNWFGQFTKLKDFENGNYIEYTVKELNIPTGYEASITGSMVEGFTITNTHVPETIDIPIVKVWDDDNNRDGIRPIETEVRLLANNNYINSVKLNSENNWEYIFTDLYKNNEGNNVNYTVEEINVPTGYEASVTGSMENGFTITNTHVPETIDITIVKVWDDDNNRDGIRPDNAIINLLADEECIGTYTKESTDNSFEIIITGLHKYKEGQQIQYTIEEIVPTGYNANITGNMTNGYKVTNVHEPELINISITKVWDDDNNRDGIRPTEIEVKLLADNQHINSVKLNSTNNWTHTFTNLYEKESGNIINYTVEEANVSTGYTAEVTGNMADGYTITNTHEIEKISVNVTKVWDDDDNRDGIRPENVTIKLYADGSELKSATLNDDNSWKYTFEGLPKNESGQAINYTIKEIEVDGYTTSIAETQQNEYIITNAHEIEKTSIKVTKQWNDDNDRDQLRPTSITVKLLGNGTEVDSITLNEDNSWGYTFTDIPKNYAGQLIEYTVDEVIPDGYTATITEKAENEFTIVNTHAIKRVDLPIEKIWDDYENKYGLRPESITFRLMESLITDENGTFIKDYENSIVVKEITLTESANSTDASTWKGVFEQVPYYAYHWLYEESITSYASNVGQAETWLGTENGFKITNTLQTTSVSVEKVWDDYNNEDGSRPGSVKVILNRNGQKQSEATLNEGNSWKTEFTGLPKYNTDGTEFSYTIEEENINGYTASYYNEVNNWTITNIHIPQIGLEVKKVWDDQNDLDEYRPTEVYAALYKNNTYSGSIVLNESNNWTSGWGSLDKYDENRNLIQYDIKEKVTSSKDSAERVPYYDEPIYSKETRQDGNGTIISYTITNKHTPKYDGYIEIRGKVWLDGEAGKGNDIDGVYNENSTIDKGVEGIEVVLRKSNGDIFDSTSKATTDANGNYTITVNYDNSKNVYKLYRNAEEVRQELQNAYVEFKYDGNLYTTVEDVTSGNEGVLSELSAVNKSKATENEEQREEFDENNSTITSSTSQITGQMITAKTIEMSNYYQKTEDGNMPCITIDNREKTIKYCNGNGTYIRTNPSGAWNEILAGQKDLATHLDHNSSEHADSGHSMKTYKVQIETINNINLGLFKREQPDIGIYEDLSKVEIIMNQKEYTYLYNVESSQYSDDPNDKTEFGLMAKFENKNTYTYRRPVNPADIAYLKEVNSNAMKAYVTYEVRLGNLSTTLPIKVNSIENVYDKHYELKEVNGVSHTENDNDDDTSFKKEKINLNSRVEPGTESNKILLKYQISLEALIGLMNGDRTLNNAVEITSYTSYYGEKTLYAEHTNYEEQEICERKDNLYGGRNNENQPGNAEFYINSEQKIDAQNKEHDTDIAPSFVLSIKNYNNEIYYKTVSGNVWEDTDEDKTDNERLGNGKRDEDEQNGIKGVKVELYKNNGTELVTMYRIKGTGEDAIIEDKDAITYTDSDGNYSFTNSEDGIPWSIVTEDTNYIIRFTYGDDSVVSTIKDVAINSRDYKSTIITEPTLYNMFAENSENESWYYDILDNYSIAVDNINMLPTDNLNYSNFDNKLDMVAESKPFRLDQVYDSDNDNEGRVDANGNPLEENGKKEFSNDLSVFDFGIIGRPKEDIFVESSVDYFKVTLANGQVITNGNPSEDGTLNYVKAIGFSQDISTGNAARNALDKQAIIELDAELIQGAQLEVRYNITVTNNSEETYEGDNYYYYGIKSADAEPVTNSVEKFIWYMDKDLVWESIDENWTAVNAKIELYENGYISDDTRKAVEEGYLPYITTTLFNNVAPGQKVSTNISAKRMLTNSDENTFDTQAEILEINSKIARTLDISDNGPEIKTYKMGNYVPSTTIRKINDDIRNVQKGLHEQDDDRIRVVITPPTGLVTYIIRYSVIALGSLIVIAGGVIFIKKKVLRN